MRVCPKMKVFGDHRSLLVVTVVLVMVLVPCRCNYTTAHAGNIEDAILANYKTTVRPADKVGVGVDLGVYHISSLSNVDQELSLSGFLLLHWSDTRLTWTANDHGNVSEIHPKNPQIWTPPIVLANSANGIKLLSDDSDTRGLPLTVKNDGLVLWLAAANYIVQCQVDITFYPFDSQECDIKVSTWTYGIDEITLYNAETAVNLQQYEENGEWDLQSSSVSLGVRNLHGHLMSTVEFSLKLKRKHSYYILNMILPVVLTSFLGCVVFLLPIDSGEKNGFALTILLSLSVIMTSLSDKIPPTSTHICILSVYLLCALSISVFEVLVTVFIQRIYHSAHLGGKLEGRKQQMARLMANITCYTSHKEDYSPPNSAPVTPIPTKNSKIYPKEDTVTVIKGRNAPQKDFNISLKNRMTTAKKNQTNTTCDDSFSYSDEQISYDYKDLSVCLDRMCFYVFFFLTFVFTLTFLVVLSSEG